MCGIAGLLLNGSLGLDTARERIRNMSNALAHRGPDEAGDFVSSDVALGTDRRPRWKEGGERRVFMKGQLWWDRHDPDFKELLDTRGKNDVESPLGEWTKVECVCDGDRISVLVNGKTVNHCYNTRPAAGKILLQTEGFELFVRKFELHPLKKP